MSKRKKAADADEIEPSDWAICLTCEPRVEFNLLDGGHDALKEHLATVHGVDIKEVKGRMTSHMDGRTWSGSNYEYEGGGVKVARASRYPRAAGDIMRYA